MKGVTFHADRLIAALKITPKQFWHEFDAPTIQNMVAVARFDKAVEHWIWEKEHKPFEVWR